MIENESMYYFLQFKMTLQNQINNVHIYVL